MNDIELAHKIDSAVGKNYEQAFEARSLYQGSEIHFVRKALEALVFNALDEYQLPTSSNLHDNIQVMQSSKLFSDEITSLCHEIRILCNQSLHFSPMQAATNEKEHIAAFDQFETLLCVYFLSIGGQLANYKKSPLDSCDLQKAIQQIYIEENLTSPQLASVAYYWYEKHHGDRNPITGEIDSLGNPFFLESAVALMKQYLTNNDDSLLKIYLCFLHEPALIDNHFDELYSIAESKIKEGEIEYLSNLSSASIFTRRNILQTANHYYAMYQEYKDEFTDILLLNFYNMFCGSNPLFQEVQPNIILAKEALLTAVNKESSQALQFYATALFKGTIFKQDFKKNHMTF